MSTKTNVIILTLAARAAGVVTRRELAHAGLSSSTIAARARQGFLSTAWAGIYEVPEMTNEFTPLFRATKSVGGSALSHQSAARICGFPLASGGAELVHITARRGTGRSNMPGVVVHQTRRPVAEHIYYPVPGLPVLSVGRTVLDLAGDSSMGTRRLSHTVEKLITEGRLVPANLFEILDLEGLHGVSGATRLRAIVEELLDDQPVVASMLERRFEDLLSRHGVVGFCRQVRPPWYDGLRGTVDFAHDRAQLIVELDGRRWHASRQAMAEDRRRDRLAATNGWLVMRVMWDDLAKHPARTAEQVAATVAVRSGGVSPTSNIA